MNANGTSGVSLKLLVVHRSRSRRARRLDLAMALARLSKAVRAHARSARVA